jgi:hypothetical protein
MGRTLTDAEAQVIGALLASTRVTERGRLQRAKVPRSTYHAARRRAYSEGWLRDRYIPNPVQYGLPYAAFTLARPFADRLGPFLKDRIEDPGTVFVACSAQLTLTIGWYPTRKEAMIAAERAAHGEFAGWSFPLVADLAVPSVPVYFDFEGTFAHLGGDGAPEGYPQGLGGTPPTPTKSAGSATERRSSWGVSTLVHRPFETAEAGRPPHLVGPLGLPWGQQRLLNSGWVRHRVLLDPGKLPPFHARSADLEVYVVGSLRTGARAEELFMALTRECRVFPFLFAVSEGRLALGALGQAPGGAGPEPGSLPRRSVLQTVRERVEGIEILEQPSSSFETRLDHRYDRLFPRRP